MCKQDSNILPNNNKHLPSKTLKSTDRGNNWIDHDYTWIFCLEIFLSDRILIHLKWRCDWHAIRKSPWLDKWLLSSKTIVLTTNEDIKYFLKQHWCTQWIKLQGELPTVLISKAFCCWISPCWCGINIFEIEVDVMVEDITSERLMFLVVMVFKVRYYFKM